MVYPEYKEASIRHIHTIDYMVAQLPTVQNQRSADNILKNVYYLAGYAIECIVVYAIYNHIGFSRTQDVTLLESFTYPFDIGFYRLCTDPRNGHRRRPRYNIMSHDFQNNCTFFSFHGIADAGKVPHFDTFVPDPNMIPLFNSWRPSVRYSNCGFTKNEILQFVLLSKDIHRKTRQFITKD